MERERYKKRGPRIGSPDWERKVRKGWENRMYPDFDADQPVSSSSQETKRRVIRIVKPPVKIRRDV